MRCIGLVPVGLSSLHVICAAVFRKIVVGRIACIAFALVMLVPILASRGESFNLKARDAERLGPFEFKNGESVALGKERYKIRIPDSIRHTALERMRSIILPEIDVKDAKASEMVKLLAEQSSAHDAREVNGRRGVNIQIGPRSGDMDDVPAVTFHARNISVLNALRIFTELAHVQYSISESGAILIHRCGEMIVDPTEKTYDVRSDIGSAISAPRYPAKISGGAFGGDDPDSGRDEDMKTFFEIFGVSWPKESSLNYVPAIGKLYVANSVENLARLDSVIETLEVVPSQIEIALQFVEFDRKDIAAINTNGFVSASAIDRLRKEGKGVLLAEPQVVTPSGQQATIKGVSEIIYPTYFEAAGQSMSGTNSSAYCQGFAVENGGFQTREEGVLLEVLPELSTEGDIITMTLTPQVVFEPDWRDFGAKYAIPDGKELSVRMMQPFFSVLTLTTSVSLKNGSSMLLGGGVPGRNKDGLVYVFASIRLIGIDGKPREPVAEYSGAIDDELFFLVPEEGPECGPFEYRNGAVVSIDGACDYALETDSGSVAALENTKGIMLPSVRFKKMAMNEVVQYLSENARAHNKPDGAGEAPGIDIVLKPAAKDMPAFRPVTMSAGNESMFEVLEKAARLAGCKIRPRNGVVMVVPEKDRDLPILHRKYKTYSDLTDYVGEQSQERSFMDFFAGFGISWPEGSGIQYIRSVGLLIVANTEENLNRFDSIMSVCNCTPCQIEVEVQCLQVSMDDVAAASGNGFMTLDALTKLRKQGRAELLGSPRVVTKSGQQATIKGVAEIIYPTDFTAAYALGTNTNTVAVGISSVAVPGGFQTREVGVLFEVLPEISVDGGLINLTCTPQIVFEPEWKDYGGEFVDDNGVTQRSRKDMPFFPVSTVTTSVRLKNGETILAGGGAPGKKKGMVIFTLVTAQMLDMDGRPMKNK